MFLYRTSSITAAVLLAGLLTEDELGQYEQVACTHAKYWVVIQWALSILVKARKEGKIASDFLLDQSVQVLQDLEPLSVHFLCVTCC